jgi:hypothetical protein
VVEQEVLPELEEQVVMVVLGAAAAEEAVELLVAQAAEVALV